MLRRPAFWFLVVLVVVGVGLQLLPYGRDRTNPNVIREPAWNSPRTRELAVGACFDCHSNETAWPWYGKIAPFSWLVDNHVTEGRAVLNFSEWNKTQEGASQVGSVVRNGQMPPWYYKLAHASARLTEPEVEELAGGLETSVR
jgi:mono/diheme cytochrome c family protein